jgi:hypothetical protein
MTISAAILSVGQSSSKLITASRLRSVLAGLVAERYVEQPEGENS